MFDSIFGQMKSSEAIDGYLGRIERVVNIAKDGELLKKKYPTVFEQFDEMLKALIATTILECNKLMEEAEEAEEEHKAKKSSKETK